MRKCEICGKRDWRLLLRLNAIEKESFEIFVDKDLQICFDCLSFIIACLIKQIDFHIEDNKKCRKETVIPSIPWARRIKMGKISEDEMLKILSKIKNMKNIEDFGGLNEKGI